MCSPLNAYMYYTHKLIYMLGHLGGSPFKFTGEEYLRAALTDSLLIYDFIHVVYDSKIINTTHTIISDGLKLLFSLMVTQFSIKEC